MLMIDPEPAAFIGTAAVRIPRNTPVWLMAIIWFHISRSVSLIVRILKMPALLTNTSSWPSSARIVSMATAHSASDVTSWARKVAASPISSAVA
jgi:hypothetical protein